MEKLFFPSLKPRFVNQQEVIESLRRLAVKLAGKNRNIEAVYLFGSYARDNASLHSDGDILVVLKQDNQSRLDRLDEFILEFSKGIIPVDVIVNTSAQIDSALRQGSHFIADALAGIRLV